MKALSPAKLEALIDATDALVTPSHLTYASMEVAIRDCCARLGFTPDEADLAVALYTNPDDDEVPLTKVPAGYTRLAYRAPLRKSIELGGGRYYTREWLKGEKVAYENSVLIKPQPKV